MAKAKPQSDLQVITNTVQRIVENAYTSRQRMLKELADPRRDIDAECGFTAIGDIDIALLRDYYDRWSFAARVVELYPAECWKTSPELFETEDMDVETEFEAAFQNLASRLGQGEDNFYRVDSAKGNPIWSLLKTADILSGIGHYGGIFLGLSGAESEALTDEVSGDSHELLYATALDESNLRINNLVDDKFNPNFGKPQTYDITFDESTSANVLSLTSRTETVHASRVVHLCDNRESSRVIGVPRQRPVWRHIQNLEKLHGGSPEMYWRGAFPGVTFETDPRVAGEMNIDETTEEGKAKIAAIRAMIEQMMNGLQRYALFDAITMKTHAPTVVSPKDQIEAELNAICIKLACPKRKFMGSERGELASSQDEETWESRLDGRRSDYCIPHVIVPFVNTLIRYGCLPKPTEGYGVGWGLVNNLSQQERADVALKRTQSMASYVAGDVQEMMEPLDYLTRELGYSRSEAMEILDARADSIAEENQRLADERSQRSGSRQSDNLSDDSDDSEDM